MSRQAGKGEGGAIGVKDETHEAGSLLDGGDCEGIGRREVEVAFGEDARAVVVETGVEAACF